MECCNFQTITVMYIKVYISGMENESENPFLIPNFTKNDDFLKKWQKSTFLVKNFCDKVTKTALS